MTSPSTKRLLLLAMLTGTWSQLATADELFPGGDTTVQETGRNAFSLPAPNLTDEQKTDFVVGNSFFKKAWVEAPSSTTARDGLGPHFIARSCGACHTEDGRGAPPDMQNLIQKEQPLALLLRLSVPDDKGGSRPEPTYGGQFNNDAIGGVRAEGKVSIRYQRILGRFADGTRYELIKPSYKLKQLGYGPLHPQTQISPRIAPQMIGLGLLEAIREEDILAIARQQKREGKGIQGVANYVPDAFLGKKIIGRFGWKANTGSIAHQSAGAFNGDIGITSAQFPKDDCTVKQMDCRKAPHGGTPEIDENTLSKVIFYSRTLAVPARRDADLPSVQRGQQLFKQANCISCHTPSYKTGAFPAIPQLAEQTIYPYTDLLLHDMGEGLADHRPDGLANGKQWKTPPLWGLGLVPAVNGHSRYLHDGRARSLMEAVLWHDGEARPAKQHVLQFSAQDRKNLELFLKSL